MAEALSADPNEIFRKYDDLCHPSDPDNFQSDFLEKYRPGSEGRDAVQSGELRFFGVTYEGEASEGNKFDVTIEVGPDKDRITRREAYRLELSRYEGRIVLLVDEARGDP